MPGGCCSVLTCKNNFGKAKRDGQHLRFFTFPKDPSISKAWVIRCKRAPDFNPKCKKVCSLHFEMSDYLDGLQARLMNFPPVKLKKDAVPSLNLPSSVLQPDTLSKSSTSDREKRYSKKSGSETVEECLEQFKGVNQTTNKNPKGKVAAPIKENAKVSKKRLMNKITVPIKRKYKVSNTYTRKKVPVTIKMKGKVSDNNTKDETTIPFKESGKVNEKTVEEEVKMEGMALPIIESIETTEKNSEKEVRVSSQDENNVSEQNTRFVVVTVPIVQTILQNPNEDCVCGVLQSCLKCQLRIVREENKDLKSRIQIHLKNEDVLKHANDLAQKRIRELVVQFENKVKVAFKHFLSSNQVDAVLKKKTKIRWTEEELSKAFNVLQFSKRFYMYLKNTLNYPLPGLSTLKKWITDTSLRIEKNSSLEYMPPNSPIDSENLSSDHIDHESQSLDNLTSSKNLPSNYHTQSAHLHSGQPIHSKSLPSDPVVSKNLNSPNENCNESSNLPGKQLKTLHFPLDHHFGPENPINNRTSTVANKSFQFHLSHKNYFNKLILKRIRRKMTKPKRFMCSICQKGFDLNGAFKRHFKTHLLENPWTCDVCDDIFSSKFFLDRHITTHRNDGRFMCDICDQSFIKKINFQDHYLKHKNIQPRDVCDAERNSSEEQCGTDQLLLSKYSMEAKVKPYLCHICNELFEDKSDLKTHLILCKAESKSYAKNVQKASYVCEWCNRGFRYHQYYQNHLQRHKNRKMFMCEICDKGFAKPQRLQRHMILHDNNKNKVQFFCNVCDKGFRQKRYLTQHLHTHSDEKQYACVLCPKKFAQNSSLKKHFETHKNDSYPNLTDLYV